MPDIDTIARQLAGGLSLDDLRRRQSGGLPVTPAERTPEQIQAEADYWQRVFSEPERRPALMVARSTVREMDYETARKKVWALLQLRAAHIEQIENAPFAWDFNDEEKQHLRNLTRYFINDPACEWPLTKGLFLYGMPGTGKTEMMQVFARFCEENMLSKQFSYTNMSEVYTRAKSDKDFDPVTPNVQFDRAFDEFGRHVGPVVRFGEPLDINEAIIEQRYERQRRYGQLTHFIANVTPNDVENAFTPMIFDRIRSMCTGVSFTGKSKRR